MKFEPPLKPAKLIRRYKRFLADVELADGSVITIHCPNTGSMKGCGSSGDTIWYSISDNPKRKYPHTWELTETAEGHTICVNTNRANQLVEEALRAKQLKTLAHYQQIDREVRYGTERSRIDFRLGSPNEPDCFVEVKSATLLEHNQGYFPDAITTRGQKHLRELMAMKELGHRTILLFAILHSGIESVQPAAHIDPAYAKLFEQAKRAGVEIGSCRFRLSPQSMDLMTFYPHALEKD